MSTTIWHLREANGASYSLSSQALRAALQCGRIAPHTLVRQNQSAAWRRVEAPVTCAPLHLRALARLIDLILAVNLVSFVAAMLAPSFFAHGFLIDGESALARYIFFALPCVLMVDALWVPLLGASLGQALLGVRLVSLDGPRISFTQMVRRSARMYLWGFGAGVPFVVLAAPLIAMMRSCGGRGFSWDRAARTQLVSTRASGARTGLVVFLLLALLAALSILHWR